MTKLRLPEDRTPTEIEKDVVCNKLIREVCLHEIRLGQAIAKEEGDRKTRPSAHYRAVMTTHEPNGIREAIYRLYGNNL